MRTITLFISQKGFLLRRQPTMPIYPLCIRKAHRREGPIGPTYLEAVGSPSFNQTDVMTYIYCHHKSIFLDGYVSFNY